MKNLNEVEKFVLQYLCDAAEVDFTTVLETRKRERVEVKFVFIKWLREYAGKGLQEIAMKVGFDNHTSVIHGIDNYDVSFPTKPKLKKAYDSISI